MIINKLKEALMNNNGDYLDKAFKEYKKTIGRNSKNKNYFTKVIVPHTLNLGIRLKSERGLELFKEIIISEKREKRKKFKKWMQMIGIFIAYNKSVWNNDPDHYALSLARITSLGLKNCLNELVDPFQISPKFLTRLEKYRSHLKAFEFSEARNIFKDADKSNEYFSAIEILAMKYFHLYVRSLVFAEETDPDVDREHLKSLSANILCDLDHFIQNSDIPRKGNWERRGKALMLLSSMQSYQVQF